MSAVRFAVFRDGILKMRNYERYLLAELAGLAPTIEGLVGLEPTLGQAHSFEPFVRPGPVWDVDGWPERSTIMMTG